LPPFEEKSRPIQEMACTFYTPQTMGNVQHNSDEVPFRCNVFWGVFTTVLGSMN